MEIIMFIKLPILVMFLTFAPTAKCQFFLPPPQPPKPLCASQFALVNHACETLPFSPLPPPSPTPPSPPSPSPPDDDKDHHGHRHRHEHEHHENDHDHEHEHGHGHGHGHGHHHHHHHITPVEENCCRWLKEVDHDCVCELLVHLPAFLARPAHSYSVTVGHNACMISYQCAGRLRA